MNRRPVDVEVWRDIPSAPGYQASDAGRVRNSVTGLIRKLQTHAVSGHRLIGFTRSTRYVHHLVLEAFGETRPETAEVRHLNGDPTDNRRENIRWDTRSANTLDRATHGADPQRNKVACPRDHRLVEPNLVPSRLKLGHRECLTCNKTRAKSFYEAKQSRPFDAERYAANKYRELMEGRCGNGSPTGLHA
jgi:hypothetical protein